MRVLSIREPCCLSTLHGQPAVASRCPCPPGPGQAPRLQKCSPEGEGHSFYVGFCFLKEQLKNHLSDIPLADAHLGEGTGVESPADVVAVLDPHVSSVGDSVNRPDPANVLQTQRGGLSRALLLHGRDPTLPSAAVAPIVGRPVFSHSVAHRRPSEPELT